jgi:LysR family transcriptional regulator, transcriptional activator of the cysJI operon
MVSQIPLQPWSGNRQLVYPNIDTYHLIVFFYVASEQNITSAAKGLCLTQPTVTKHIKTLENATGLKLVEVNHKRVTLTPAGEGLYCYAREIYSQALAANRYIRHIKYSNINIGASPLLVSPMAKSVQALYRNSNSEVKVNLRFEAHAELIQDVIDSKLDLAIAPDLGYGNGRVSRVLISDKVKLIFYASPLHPIFKKEPLEWRNICDYPLLIGHEPSAPKRAVPEKLRAEGVTTPLNEDLSADNVECCKRLVQNGKHISMALQEDIEHEVSEGKLRILTLPSDIYVEVYAIAHQGALTSPIIQNFITCVKASF